MLQDRIALQLGEDYTLLNHELKQYKKINFSLRKKIKEKDHKIQQLFGYIDDASKQYGYSPENNLPKNPLHPDRHHKLTLSDNRKKEKQNKNQEFYDDSNIFKHPSIHAISKLTKEQIHLPALQKKAKNIFSPEEAADNPEKKGRLIRIPIEKLKPLDSDEVKKRFLLKFGKGQSHNE